MELTFQPFPIVRTSVILKNLVLLAAIVAFSHDLRAATYFWDPNNSDGILSGGSGIWATSGAPNWTLSSTGTGTYVNWPATTGNAATFGGPDASPGVPYSVQVPGIVNGDTITPVTLNVDTITFSADGYNISSDTPGTKLVSAIATSITGMAGKTFTFGSNITVQRGSSATTINGGTLVFDTGSAFTAGGGISYGSTMSSVLQINTGASFSTTGTFTDTWGQVVIGGTFSAQQLVLGPNAESGGLVFQPFTLNNGSLVTIPSGVFMGGSGQNSRGRLTLNGGTLVTNKINRGTPSGSANGSAAAIITFNGGTVQASANNPDFFGVGGTTTLVSSATVMDGGAIFDTAGFNIGIAKAFASGTSTDGGFIKKGAGTLTLSAVSTYKGATKLQGGSLVLTATTASALPTTDLEISGHSTLDVMGAVDSFASASFQDVNMVDGFIRSTNGAAEITATSYEVGNGIMDVSLAGTSAALTKTTNGTVELNAINSYGGPTNVLGGTLKVSATSAIFSSSAVNVADNATLTGGGYVNGIVLNPGAMLAPGDAGAGILKAASLLWNSDDTVALIYRLSNTDNTSSQLSLELGGMGSFFNKGTGNTFVFDFQNTGFYNSITPTVYTLVNFETTNFDSTADFSYVNLADGLSGTFALNSNNLQFIVSVPEPGTLAMLAGGLAILALISRARRKAVAS